MRRKEVERLIELLTNNHNLDYVTDRDEITRLARFVITAMGALRHAQIDGKNCRDCDMARALLAEWERDDGK